MAPWWLPSLWKWESGRKAEHPQPAAALAEARKRRAMVAVAKLDWIARDAELVLRIRREADINAMGGFLFCDLPEIDTTTSAGRLILEAMASVAEFEGRRITERTRENAAAKDRATNEVKKLRAMLGPLAAAGLSLRAMGAALAGAETDIRSDAHLGPSQVARLLQWLELGRAAFLA